MSAITAISSRTYSHTSGEDDEIKQLQDQVRRLQQQEKTISGSNQDLTDKQAKLNDINTEIQQLQMQIEQLVQDKNDKNQNREANNSDSENMENSENAQAINGGTMRDLMEASSSYKTAARLRNAGTAMHGRSEELRSDAKLDAGKNATMAAKENSEASALEQKAQAAGQSAQTHLQSAIKNAQQAGKDGGKSTQPAAPVQNGDSAQKTDSTAGTASENAPAPEIAVDKGTAAPVLTAPQTPLLFKRLDKTA